MKRREFIALLTASGARRRWLIYRARAQQTLPDPAAWLHAGPMLGRSEITATEIWLQTKKPCLAAARFWKQGKPETARLSEIVRTTESGDFIARFNIERLEFGVRYD